MGKTLRQRQMAKARYAKRAIRKMNPKPASARMQKADFIRALKGTGGIKAHIAENLGCQRKTVCDLLQRPDWTDVLAEYEQEVAGTSDDAERCVREMIRQRYDSAVAAATAKWYLAKIRREIYGDETKTIIEGGRNPIRTHATVTNADLNIDALNLPLEVKRQILDAIEARDAARLAEDNQPL